MVATPSTPQQRSAGENVDFEEGSWGTMQIATPAVVGGGLLLILAALSFILWRRRVARDRPYTKYRQVPDDWVNRVERIFPCRTQRRVCHSGVITIADSMHTPNSNIDPLRSHRSASSDSRTPLTTMPYDPAYPPKRKSSDPLPSIPKRHHTLRWWWLFGARPREVKSEEPNPRWRVDGPDGSSSGHGSHGHEESHTRYDGGGLEALHEDVEVDTSGVIQIGQDFTSIPSTPLTRSEHFIEYARPVRGTSPVAEHPLARPLVCTPQLSSANRGLPPSYDVSQGHTLVRYPSVENVFHSARSGPRYMRIPPPRTAVHYSSPRGFHGRELSSESVVVVAQQPVAIATPFY